MATSMVTPVGASPRRVHSSVEAGISRYRESNIMAPDGEPFRVASVPNEALKLPGEEIYSVFPKETQQQRLLRLAYAALIGIKPQLPPNIHLPLFVAGPDSSVSETGIDHAFLEALKKLTDISIDIDNSRAANIGRAGGIAMLDIASRYFDATGAEYALVGGVDSYMDVSILNELHSQNRLLGVNAVGGFVPAEAASFLLIVSPKAKKNAPSKIMAKVVDASMNQALNSESEKATLASIATDIFAEIAKAFSADCIPLTYSTFNGEAHWIEELTIAAMRNRRYFSENHKFAHPAEYFGDVGAAFAPILIGLAIENACSPSMIYCASDSGLRAAVCLSSS